MTTDAPDFPDLAAAFGDFLQHTDPLAGQRESDLMRLCFFSGALAFKLVMAGDPEERNARAMAERFEALGAELRAYALANTPLAVQPL